MAITTPGAVDYHLACQSGGNLSFNPQLPLTLMVWLNTAVWSSAARVSMFGTYNSATAGGTAVQIGTSTGAGEISCWTWGGTVLIGSTGYTAPSNTWIHIAYAFDGTVANGGTNTHRLYINGVLNNSNTTGTQLAGTITSVYINGYPGGGVSETGVISVEDARYYNRVLSANEILSAYTSYGDRDGIVSGLIASYSFSENAPGVVANNIKDIAGGGNTLTPIGAAAANFTFSTSIVAGDCRPPLG
jgi:hypothetical protein